MKKILHILLALTIVGIIVFATYRYEQPIAYITSPFVNNIESALNLRAPCSSPLYYSVGELDSQFGLSKDKLLSDAAAAAATWNKAAGKTVLQYSPTGELPINLIYDYRQKATAEMKDLGITIKNNQASYDSLKAKYDSLNDSYASEKAQLDQQTTSYTAAKNQYEQQVAYWNSRGGAPESEYMALEQQRQSLNSQADSINSAQEALNATVDQINSAATVLNQLTQKLNLNVKNYNSIGASTGIEFDEGEYVSDISGDTINIYEYANNDQLIRVLTHEMGHALGLEHVNDPKAIMYPLNQSTNEVPTTADIAELKSVCHL